MQRVEQASFSDSTAAAGNSAIQDTSKEMLSKDDPMYKQLFNRADKSGNGTVSKEELTIELTDCYAKASNKKASSSAAKGVFDALDTDRNGTLDKTEMNKFHSYSEDDQRQMARIMHLDDKNVISADGTVGWNSVQKAEVDQSKKYAEELVASAFKFAGKDPAKGQELTAQELSDGVDKALNKSWDGTEFNSGWDYSTRDSYRHHVRNDLESMENRDKAPPHGDPPNDITDAATESMPRHRSRRHQRHADQGEHRDGPSPAESPARPAQAPPQRPSSDAGQAPPSRAIDY